MKNVPLTAACILSLASLGAGQLAQAQMPSPPPQPRLESPVSPGEGITQPGTQFQGLIPAGDMALPPQGEPGKCYARVYEPPVYGTETDKMLAKEAAERIEIIPAQYEWVEEKVLVREAYQREDIIPATYETVTEKILVKPASTHWEKGRGLIEKVDNFTGEIMCLKEDPAVYKTVTKQVIKTPATTKQVQVPAEYQTVKVRKMVKPAQEKRNAIPAEYQTVTRTVLKSPGRMVWKSVICETNAPPEMLKKVVEAPPPPLPSKELYAKSKEEDWFFLWKWDPLFDQGKFVTATE